MGNRSARRGQTAFPEGALRRRNSVRPRCGFQVRTVTIAATQLAPPHFVGVLRSCTPPLVT